MKTSRSSDGSQSSPFRSMNHDDEGTKLRQAPWPSSDEAHQVSKRGGGTRNECKMIADESPSPNLTNSSIPSLRRWEEVLLRGPPFILRHEPGKPLPRIPSVVSAGSGSGSGSPATAPEIPTPLTHASRLGAQAPAASGSRPGFVRRCENRDPGVRVDDY